jgi:hypothetical protein
MRAKAGSSAQEQQRAHHNRSTVFVSVPLRVVSPLVVRSRCMDLIVLDGNFS